MFEKDEACKTLSARIIARGLVKVEAESGYPADWYGDLRQKTEQLLYERILVRIAVEIEPPGTLPRYELKAKRFFDHRQR